MYWRNPVGVQRCRGQRIDPELGAPREERARVAAVGLAGVRAVEREQPLPRQTHMHRRRRVGRELGPRSLTGADELAVHWLAHHGCCSPAAATARADTCT